MPGKALVITHEVSRTNPPRIALEVASSLVEAEWSVATVARWTGPLLADLADRSSVLLVEPGRRVRALLGRVGAFQQKVTSMEERVATRILRNLQPDFVWANTAFSAAYVRSALREEIPVVLHVHESEPWVSRLLDRYGVTEAEPGLHLLAATPGIRDELVARFSTEGIDCLSPSIDEEATRASVESVTPEDRVVACGTPDEGNGVDVWLGVASEVVGARPGTELVWVGGPVPDRWRERAGEIGPTVRMAGPVADPAHEIAAGRVFVVTARRPGFRLVVLVAMALGRAVVAFDVGGIREQVGDAGILLERGDISAMASEVTALLDDPARLESLGAAARARVAEHYSVDAFAERVRRLGEQALRDGLR